MSGPMRLGSFSPSVVLRVARETGALARAGITVEETPVASSPAQIRALLTGELDAALTSPDNVLLYRFVEPNPLGGRHDLRVVLAVDRGLGLSLFLGTGMTDVDQLRGGRLGVDVAASGFAFAAYELLARRGLRRGQDFTVVELGSTPRRLRALLEGACEATMLNAGNDLLADDAGLVRAARLTDVVTPYVGTVLAVTGERLDAEDGRIGALVAAFREAVAAIVDGSARAQAAAAAADALGPAPGLADRYVAALLDPADGLVADGRLDDSAVRALVELRRRHSDRTGGLDAALAHEGGLVDARFSHTGG